MTDLQKRNLSDSNVTKLVSLLGNDLLPVERGGVVYGIAAGNVAFAGQFNTLADAVSSTALAIGQYVSTKGRETAGGPGSGVYKVVAAGTGTVDGGRYINTTGIVAQLELQPSRHVSVEQFYDPSSTDNESAAFQAASDWATTIATNDTQGVLLTLSSPIYIADQVTIGSGNVDGLNIDFSAGSINLITGGDLDSATPAIKVNSQNSTLRCCKIFADNLSPGWWFNNCARSRAIMPFTDHFLTYGVKCDGSSSGDFVLEGVGGNEWQPGDTEFDTESNFTGDTLIVDCADMKVEGGNPGWAARNIYIGTSATNVVFNGVHPFNGNPQFPPARDNPFCVESDAAGKCYFYDCYFDNGYVIDNTSKLQIYGGRHLNLSDRVTLVDPVIRVKVQADESNDRFSIHANDATVGFFSTDWETLEADWDWHHTNILESIGPVRFTTAYRQMTTLYIDDDNATVEERFIKRGGDTEKIIWEFVTNTDDDTSDPLRLEFTDDTLNLDYAGGPSILSINGLVGLSVGSGNLKFLVDSLGLTPWEIQTNGTLRPTTDDTYNLGGSSLRISNGYIKQLRPGSGNLIWTAGAGSPEGVLTAPIGSLYARNDGGAGTSLYLKISGTGNTGWVAIGAQYVTAAWTPEIADAETGGNVGSYSGNTLARYTRSGNIVDFEFYIENIDTTGLTAGNDLYIRGLPFTVENITSSSAPGMARLSNITFTTPPFLSPRPNTTALRLRENVSGSTATTVLVSQLTSGTASIWGRGSYRVA